MPPMPPMPGFEEKKIGPRSIEEKYASSKGKFEPTASRGGGPGPGRGPGGPGGRNMMREKPKNMGKTLGKLIRYIGKNKYLVYALILIMVLTTLLNLAGPALQGMAIDKITLTDKQLHVDFEGLLVVLMLMVGIYLINSLLTYIQGLLSAKMMLY